jgi:phage terminase Nu1 subunit (DNA packaging protein)
MPLTHDQIAKRFNVSASTVSYWKSKGCPVRGTVAQIDKWRKEFEATNPRKSGPTSDPQLAQIKKALLAQQLAETRSKAAISELKRQRMEGSLVPIQEAKALIGKIVDRARTAALNLPKTHAKKFVGLKDERAAQKQIDALVRDVLAVLAIKPGDA